jgi:hypothetical protein
MSWVEELKPEDDVTVEIVYPAEYVEYCASTIRRFAKGIACLCKGAVLLGDDETEFLVFDMMVVQVVTVEEAMKQFGIELTHEMGVTDSGKRWTYFYADLKGLREKMESGEIL